MLLDTWRYAEASCLATDIWNHLYDMCDQSSSNVVDVYIGYLRRKLEARGGSRLIHTRRGLGYVLEVLP